MGQWLVADLSVMDIHFQLWMVLVTVILLVWICLCMGQTPRSLRSDFTQTRIFVGVFPTLPARSLTG
jgi:hypothetical protein